MVNASLKAAIIADFRSLTAAEGQDVDFGRGIVRAMASATQDNAAFTENFQERTETVSFTVIRDDKTPVHGDTFTHEGATYIVTSIQSRAGSPLARITATLQQP